MSEYTYVGSELDLFAVARNWKSYWSRRLRPFIAGDVLEVGAGIGSNGAYLRGEGVRKWTCLEPDPRLTEHLIANLERNQPNQDVEVICGTLPDLRGRRFDTIVYIDVLEHIEEDGAELAAAGELLRQGGRVVVLAPAHQSLFTPFDAAIGHYRRYNRSMFRQITPPILRLEEAWYLDSAGLILSSANRLLLHQSMPTAKQIAVWDRVVIPVSRVVDPLLCGAVGKSVVGIWGRDESRS